MSVKASAKLQKSLAGDGKEVPLVGGKKRIKREKKREEEEKKRNIASHVRVLLLIAGTRKSKSSF